MKYLQIDLLDELNAILTCWETTDSKAYGRVEVYACSQQRSERRLLKRLEQQYHQDQSQRRSSLSHAHSHSLPMGVPSVSHATTTSDSYESDLPSSASPPSLATHWNSPLGRMDDVKSRKTLFYLISTLNMSFPDYDFSSIKPHHFARHRLTWAVQEIHQSFMVLSGERVADIMSRKLWDALDEVIGPNAPAVIETTVQRAPAEPKRRRTAVGADAEKGSKVKAAASAETRVPQGWDDLVEIYTYEPDEASGAGDPYADDDEEGMGTVWSLYYFFFNRKLKRLVFFTLRNVGMSAAASRRSSEADEAWSLEEESTPVSPEPPLTPEATTSAISQPQQRHDIQVHIASSFVLPPTTLFGEPV